LFHCHITYHVTNDIRLPEADKFDDPNSHAYHMSGLVIGLDVADGKSDLIQKGTPRKVSLVANETDTLRGFRIRFSTENGSPQRPGPMLVLNQYQPTYVTVENKMSEPTSVHWHGLELDSWADGVPGWSQSDNKASPEIVPGGKFTYQLSLMHSGTFIYHSHLNDQLQLREGLYGALIVLPEGKVFDPNYDHVYMVGQKMIDDAKSPEDIDVNGVLNQPLIVTEAGSKHRLRLINIGLVEMTKANEPITITQIAKDGAALPAHRQKEVLTSDDYGVGETADFEFHAAEPGEYVLKITYYGQTVEQVWKVLITKPGTISSE
jgi:FtsP/CotA-like multicopper oxidase with cupredoxin domain